MITAKQNKDGFRIPNISRIQFNISLYLSRNPVNGMYKILLSNTNQFPSCRWILNGLMAGGILFWLHNE